MRGLFEVTKRYGTRAVLSHFTLELPVSGGVCLFGPSGCGKTTALRLLCGLEAPDAGSVRGMEGLRVACQFQEDRLLPWYTVRRNLALAYPDALPLRSREAEADAWLARVGLADAGDKLPFELSGGMRRRASLARALMFGGDVLVLDEPLKELDDAMRRRMLRLIAENMKGRTTVLVTHSLEEAERLGLAVLRMPAGGETEGKA